MLLFPISLLCCVVLLPQAPTKTLRQHYETAEAKRAAGDLAAAEAEYDAILAESYDKLGGIYSAEKKFTRAIETFETATRYKPNSPELLVRLAIAYFEAEQYEKEFVPLETAIKLNPNSLGAHHMLGKTYFMRRSEEHTSELQSPYVISH